MQVFMVLVQERGGRWPVVLVQERCGRCPSVLVHMQEV